MSLASREPKVGSNQGLPCSVASILAELDETAPTEAKTLRKWLAAPWRHYGHDWIERQLLEEGHAVGRGSVGKHRRGDCRCTRSPK